MRNFLRKISPHFLLTFYRSYKKLQQNKRLSAQKKAGKSITKEQLINDFIQCGIEKGDNVLVHASLSKIGHVENGPKDIVDALLEVVGETGNILMPNSPNAFYQLDYIQQQPIFDVQQSKSKLGALTEYFRKLPNAKRSEHPTEPVSCIGPDTEFFTASHFGENTPYTINSPFYKLTERNGKILYIGVTLANAGTSLHLLEDAIPDFKFPVYHPTLFDVQVVTQTGEIKEMKTYVHAPEQSKQRKCDELIPLFEDKGVMVRSKIGQAPTLVVSAKGMFDTMINAYNEKGVTMYTPKGS
ncbi:MAG: AAC(3) family N-acetyltransferase [Crocinitomicaceae bacterium]|nr:AAC(3) family N-acetyltransferase [Crocinitomicaceae bacterium]